VQIAISAAKPHDQQVEVGRAMNELAETTGCEEVGAGGRLQRSR
jgi:hypothetical protein